MSKLKESIIMLAIASIILTFCAGIVFSQMPFEQGGRKPEGGTGSPEGMVTGEVIVIDNEIIVVLTPDGKKEELRIGSRTSFVKESSITEDQIKMGDNLFVIGQHSGEEDIIHAIMIRVLDKSADIKRGPPSRPQGFEGRELKVQGPVIGIITELEPLTIRDTSGGTKVIKITEVTRLLKETPVKPSEIEKGIKVRVVAPPKPGMERREAMKIIVLSEGRPSFREGSGKELTLANLPLADLPPQLKDSDFIYGIWIGRGLYSNEELDRAFRVAHNLGIKYLKVELKWDYIEPENNKYVWNNQNTIDVEHLIKLARQYNLSIIPYFDLFMPWVERRYLSPDEGTCEGPPSRRGQYQSPDPKEYADYVFSVVDKFRKNGVDVRYIELDNEVSNGNDGYSSWSCFINITAKQIKEAENAAYNKVKEVYPDVMISSTTFLFPGMSIAAGRDIVKKDVKMRNRFIKVYFGEEPKPNFDFLGIHEVLGGSGNPYTTRDKPGNADYEYKFGSYHDAYDMWREILDKYGYKDTPIFNLESGAVIKGMQDAELIQRAVFARTDSDKNKVIGWVLSQLTTSKKFGEKSPSGSGETGITKLHEGYELRTGYYGYYTLMTTLANYLNYEGKVMGELNAQKPWVEKFSDNKGNILYAAFIPYKFGSHETETIDLKIGPNKEAKITRSDTKTSVVKSQTDGSIILSVDHHPLFIEVKN